VRTPSPSISALDDHDFDVVRLDPSKLQAHRIVGYDGKDPLSRPFDVLRTEVLRSMDLNGWKTVAVTAPTSGCGKTLTAINLALSMARQPERQVCLIDLDLRKPQVGACLGLTGRDGTLGIIEGRLNLGNAMVKVEVGNSRLDVLPTAPSSDPSDLIGSNETKLLLQDIAGYPASRIAIIDLPPLLTGHDALSILPHVDCVLFIVAAGISKLREINDCNKYLQSVDVVRFVLNKAPEAATKYVYY